MTYEDKQKTVIDFFEYYIENFICKDLEILSSIRPHKETGLGGCTIPMGMTIISSIELLGFLLNKNGKTGESQQNITFFLEYRVVNNLFPSYYNKCIIEKIYNYRHGMMHHFFPKLKGKFAGICKDETNQNIFISHLINNAPEDSLNVSVLYDDFLLAITILKTYLESKPEEDILDTIIKGLKGLENSLNLCKQTTSITTINPGTPKNK